LSGLIKPNEMNFVHKRWGWELWITNNEKYCGKKLFIKQGKFCSYHHHGVKDEVLFVDQGKIQMTYGSKDSCQSVVVDQGSGFHVEPGLVHQMYAFYDTMIIEFSTQHFDEDSYRVTTDLVADPDHMDQGFFDNQI
jgi:mannose-6-phosphate isomerase-like protein (cupin superfamily)